MQSTFFHTLLIAIICLTSPLSILASETQQSDQNQTQTEFADEEKESEENTRTITVPDKLSEAQIELLEKGLDKDQLKKLVTDAEHKESAKHVLVTNDAVIFGMLMLILGIIFYTSKMEHSGVKFFYKVVPMLLLCYFVPSLLTFFRIIDPETSSLYFVASRYLLPASLVLLTLSIDLKEIFKLGPKALIMFGTGTVGVILGGPIAIFIVSFFNPELVGGSGYESVWRGFSTVAGSWIGGGANQAAMKEIWYPTAEMTASEIDKADKFYGVMVAVDVIVAEIWMVFLLLGVGKAKTIDRWFKADASSIDELQRKMEHFSMKQARVPSATDLMVILCIAFGITAISHWMGDILGPYIGENFETLKKFSLNSKFFWLIVLATTFGIGLSFTPLRNYEGAGASKIGTVFIFILVATIGMKMDIRALGEHPGLFLVGGIWMLFHVGLLVIVGWLIRAPYFFLAVGSKANIGGAASAPVVAAAFHPSLAPVGVLLAVLGYALGTYGAWLCAVMMQEIAPVTN